ncbi:hypothetical protein GCM10022255_111830 [Dactylosporangium darangshiense]|uniref:Uncharacterized protein n=1 Tax=Dactylosporangium darangshiense TaxID=579108 RepID=A0ABP8DUX7_9ACTN
MQRYVAIGVGRGERLEDVAFVDGGCPAQFVSTAIPDRAAREDEPLQRARAAEILATGVPGDLAGGYLDIS